MDIAGRYRKRPVEVDAFEWHKNGDHPDDDCETLDVGEGSFQGEGKVVRYFRRPDVDGRTFCKYCSVRMHNHGWIDTVQGGHIVCPRDVIITDERVEAGKHGHFYPCKPDIFELTYEKV